MSTYPVINNYLVNVLKLGYITFKLDSCMNFATALRHTMSEFRLTGTELSQKSGVHQNTISAFRQGGQSLSVENLEKLIAAMPEEAREYFFSEIKNAEYILEVA